MATADSRRKPCPVCGKPSTAESAPFCSARCHHVDLGRWLNGVYAIPATEADDDGEEAEE